MPEYIVGVDIGSTKSHLALFDTDGNFLDLGYWGPLNHEVLPGSYRQFKDEFGRFTAKVISRHGINIEQVAYTVLGVSGVDTQKQHGVISDILKELEYKKFTLVNDAFLGIPAGNSSGTRTGICAINGSGGTLAGINKEGKMLQIGGVGDLSADMGGGGYIGQRLLSAVYSELFRRGEATLLTGMLFKEFGITSKYNFIAEVQEKSAKDPFILRSCNRFVFEAAGLGDTIAAGILQDMALNYAGGISCMIEELQFPPEDELHIVFAGSIFVKGENPMLLDMLKAKVSGEDPKRRIKFVLLDIPNVAGAVIWAFDETGKSGYYDKICSQFRDAE